MHDGLLRMEAWGLEIFACEHLDLIIQELIHQHAQVNKPLPYLAYFIVEPQYRPNLVLDLRHRTPDGLADHLPVIRSLPQGRVFCQLAFDITELGKKQLFVLWVMPALVVRGPKSHLRDLCL